MTAPMLTLPLSNAIAGQVKKKRVLLVDSSPAKRDLRSEIMRKLGMDVDCAADISEARCWWRADLYDLVLINIGNELGPRNKFCEDIRGATPPQQLAFLVGKPEYLAESPNEDGVPSIQKDGDPARLRDAGVAVSADISGGLPQRWGILEACRRISAVRSVADARSRAVRARPTPPRDLEARYSKSTEGQSQVLPELLREEMQ